MNYRFSNISDYLGKHCNLSYVSIPKTMQSFIFCFIATRETLKLLNSVSVWKSTGLSAMPTWALEDCSTDAIDHFLFKAFISESKIPSQFKQAIVTLIFRKGDSEDPQNYSPISFTFVPSKLFERSLATLEKAFDSIQNNILEKTLFDLGFDEP